MDTEELRQLSVLLTVYERKEQRCERAYTQAVKARKLEEEKLEQADTQLRAAHQALQDEIDRWQQKLAEEKPGKEGLLAMRYVMHAMKEKIAEAEQECETQKQAVSDAIESEDKSREAMLAMTRKLEKMQMLTGGDVTL